MPTPTTQKALVITEIGNPLTLITDRPVPTPGPNQVQVKVLVAGVNGHDAKSRAYGLFIKRDVDGQSIVDVPFIPTNDVVGLVTELGPGVTDLQPGDRIVSQASFGLGSTQKGLQEYALADIGALAKIPASISNDEAATLPTNITAPLVALFITLDIPAPWTPPAATFNYADKALLVVGGGSNCGQFGVQLAKLAGIGTIVVVGGDEAKLKSFGATHVINRHLGFDAVLAQIREIVGDDLVYAYDAVNPPEGQLLAANALSSSKKGALVRLLPLGPVDESRVVGKKAGFEVRDVFGSSHAHPEFAAEFWARVPGFLTSGEIKPLDFVVKQGLLPEHVNEVLDRYAAGEGVLKTHIHL
ncbi:putative alcohol dehydrogenase [Aspergillus heterothallicus]